MPPETNEAVDNSAADAAAESAAAGKDQPNTGETGDGQATNESSATKAEGDAGDNKSNTEGDSSSYADFEMPEGMDVDKGLVDRFTPLLKEVKADQETAQKFASAMAEQVKANEQAQIDAFSQQVEQWGNEVKADKELGGDNFEKTSGIALETVKKFGSPEVLDLMTDFGIGNNIHMVRMMYKIGLATMEDNPGNTNRSPSQTLDRESIMYPNN